MRAMSTAIFFLVINIIALGGGPTAVGFLADIFLAEHGQVHALRLAISIVIMAFLAGACFFLMVAKTLPKDWQDAQLRNQSDSGS